jgi:glycosyltransferase involved in cell wall biosynthesis
MRGGGAERAMSKLASGFAARGLPIDLVLASAEGPYLKELSPLVRVVDLKASRTLTAPPALARYLRSEQPAAMLSVLRHANIAALWAKRLARTNTRLVVNMQNTLSQEIERLSGLRARLVMSILRRVYPWADAITAVSHGVARDMLDITGFPARRIQVIHNPIVTSELDQMARAPINHLWLEPGEPPLILGVGRMVPQKDFVNLIEAFHQLRQTHKARLLILGEGPERPKLEDAVRTRGLEADVQMPGFVDNPYPYMRKAGAFVLSSTFEGLPSVLIEALYCGAPLVATNCPRTNERNHK